MVGKLRVTILGAAVAVSAFGVGGSKCDAQVFIDPASVATVIKDAVVSARNRAAGWLGSVFGPRFTFLLQGTGVRSGPQPPCRRTVPRPPGGGSCHTARRRARPQTSVMNRLPGTSPLRFQPFVEGAPAAHVIFE